MRLVQNGQASALATAPISKKELVDFAEFEYPGHTEFLEALTGAGPEELVEAGHVALRDLALSRLTNQLVYRCH